MNKQKILFTGGSGLLGKEVRKLLPEAQYPGRSDFNIEDYHQMDNYLKKNDVNIIIHAAAFTSPPKINKNPVLALDSNIIGTANITKLCFKHQIKLFYISTDYVFRGDVGNYSEEDLVLPQNNYAWSKLGGECAVQIYNNSLIIRTSFSENDFPYDKAFTDQWTSRLPVTKLAENLILILEKGKDLTGIIHIGGPRQTVFEYANEISPDKEIGRLSINDMSFKAPKDTSLDISKFRKLVN